MDRMHPTALIMSWKRGLPVLSVVFALQGCFLFEPEFSSNPDSARIVSDDIGRFWEAFDAAYAQGVTAGERPDIYQRLYLDPGTDGLDEFVKRRLESAAQLAEAVHLARMYYGAIRQTSLNATSPDLATEVRSIYRSLLMRYDDARFPDVYFLVGRLGTGGTTTDPGILIGVEMFSRTADTPVDELNPWAQAVTRGSDYLPATVAHELAHAQQKHPAREGDNLLAFAITEGVADFVGELLTGLIGTPNVHEYADPIERELWREFQEDMLGTTRTGWMGNAGQSGDRPADLGYYVGYQIAEASYATATDKDLALREMFRISDYEEFLVRSGYDP